MSRSDSWVLRHPRLSTPDSLPQTLSTDEKTHLEGFGDDLLMRGEVGATLGTAMDRLRLHVPHEDAPHSALLPSATAKSTAVWTAL